MKNSIKVINKSCHDLPRYETEGSSCMDVKANLHKDKQIVIKPLGRAMIPTGLSVQIPTGYEIQVRPRSGLSLREGKVAILGTIDSDYRGVVGIIVCNLSNDDITILDGERIAQISMVKVYEFVWDEVDKLDKTERGEGGFGSTGKS